MKGMVFTEFTEMVDSLFSVTFTEDLLAAADLPSGGAYTAVGTYSHTEMLRLVEELSQRSGIAAPELQRRFGHYLFPRFVTGFPWLFSGCSDCFQLLAMLDSHVHAEVRKLYPDAELPTFEHRWDGAGNFVFVYRSGRPFADLAQGLIEGAIAHFGTAVTLRRSDLDGAATEFRLETARP